MRTRDQRRSRRRFARSIESNYRLKEKQRAVTVNAARCEELLTWAPTMEPGKEPTPMTTDVTTRDNETQISTGIVSELRSHLFGSIRILRASSRQTLSSAHSKRLLNLARQLESFIDPITTLVEVAVVAKPEGRS